MSAVKLLATLLLCFLLGCGGGTSGTGPDPTESSAVTGVIVDTDGALVEGIDVQVIKTGAHDVSRPDGNFILPEDSVATGEIIRLTQGSRTIEITIDKIPESARNVDIRIVINRSTFTIVEIHVTYDVGGVS